MTKATTPTTPPPNAEEVRLTKLLKTLTGREAELLCRLTTDPTNEEVADAMCVSPKSIANYKNRIGEKLGLKGNRTILKFVLKNCAFFSIFVGIFTDKLPSELLVKIPTKAQYI